MCTIHFSFCEDTSGYIYCVFVHQVVYTSIISLTSGDLVSLAYISFWYVCLCMYLRPLKPPICVSPFPKSGDTAFIVLRKQRLIFLHWYHHITVLLYSWYSYKDMVAGGGWFMTMNYSVHALMYSYYAARAAKLHVPRPFAVLITSAQIAQMAMGLTVSGLVYGWMRQGDCHSSLDNIVWASLMYLSYLVLFSQFFYQTYLRGSAHKAAKID